MSHLLKFSDTELELMETIWECQHPVTSSELLRIFGERGKHWKSQTISTFLSRLVEKGALRITNRQGRTNSYTPCISQKDYRLQETQTIINGLYEGSVKNMISALYDGERLSDSDITELKQWFSRK
ncbi:Predicted transcriptional regulator [Fontibacillus panacisegetis]|uniref:Predicted transcriptional regulator n=1 Tax=Fontibacillus panacisegetis TaxID=670482 RepID=A0A1G7N360_9BACL|nr:BlaI/MecI/CopY family transcriptional regulator [Fontibacillus panacisegetis]SDF68483.1 Predicted transcriptional regulator [Fontibacillus panacisegetis]